MPQVVAQAWVPVAPSTAFAVSQTTGATRLRWDPFIRSQHFVDAEHAAKDVLTFTRASLGLSMTSRYVSYRPPTSVGMTMERGPWFFATFGGGWRFEAASRNGVDGTQTVWKYTYAIRPRWLRGAAEPMGQWLLGSRSAPGSPRSPRRAATRWSSTPPAESWARRHGCGPGAGLLDQAMNTEVAPATRSSQRRAPSG